MLHILSLDEKLKALTRIYNHNNNFSFLSNSIWILDRSANLFVLVDWKKVSIGLKWGPDLVVCEAVLIITRFEYLVMFDAQDKLIWICKIACYISLLIIIKICVN